MRLSATGLVLAATCLLATPAVRAASSGPIAVAPDGDVWVVNPDSDTVAHIDAASHVRRGEFRVGTHPRGVAVTATGIVVTGQGDDSVTRLATDGTVLGRTTLDAGCAPYAVAAAAQGDALYVTCQGTSRLLVLGPDLAVQGVVALDWPDARALAVAADGAVYVTHLLTREPNAVGHVSEIDVAAGVVRRVLGIQPDDATCETVGSGRGVANLLEAVAVAPEGAPAAVAGQLWVGGTLQNARRKGLFERSPYFRAQPGAALFPDVAVPANDAQMRDFAARSLFRPGLHDVARAVIWRLDRASGRQVGTLDVAGGGQIAGLAFTPAGDAAVAVDQIANGYYVFSPARGVAGNVASLFGPAPTYGPGGASPDAPCTTAAGDVVAEDPFLLAPQARLVPTGGMLPRDESLAPVATGVEWTLALGGMRAVPDGVGTTPIGVALSPDGATAWVASYLARAVTAVAAMPASFRCDRPPLDACRTRADCDAASECMPLVRAVVPSTAIDPLPPEILDGKILFSTAARDATGAHAPTPAWNALPSDGSGRQGDAVNLARDGGGLACVTCHADFGGHDGRTWDFSQLGSSLRNTMDLRGRASFAPGRCTHDAGLACTTDAACRVAGGASSRCAGDTAHTPPYIEPAARDRFFDPMGSAHWNGDRDEVEDFEHTLRLLLGAGDCDDAAPGACAGALVLRRDVVDARDVAADLASQPNRGASVRLDHLADFVYDLREFPQNPHRPEAPSAAAARGRKLFVDPRVGCAGCHARHDPGVEQFTDKRPDPGWDPTRPPSPDGNPPLVVHDVGTANLFDRTDPARVAADVDGLPGTTRFQDPAHTVPASRGPLAGYVTPVLNDVWNTAPYLHDGSAATLLDVVRPCSTAFAPCEVRGRGRNVDDRHGATSFLSATQLNDLVAFLQAPHGPLTQATAVRAAPLTVRRLALHVRGGRLRLRAGARFPAEDAPDVVRDGLAVSVGTPDGHGAMLVREWRWDPGALPGTAARVRVAARGRGVRRLVLRVARGRVTLALHARGDFAGFASPEPEYTVALESGAHVAAVTRPFTARRRGRVVAGP